MTTFHEFRLRLRWFTGCGRWYARILRCPCGDGNCQDIDEPLGYGFPRPILKALQGNELWPDSLLMEKAGSEAWQAVTTAGVRNSLGKAMERVAEMDRRARDEGNGRHLLRVRVVVRKEESADPPPAGEARPDEVPLELLRDPADAVNPFVCLRGRPVCLISRQPIAGFEGEPGRQVAGITLPLRLLVVAALPDGYPNNGITAEYDALQTRLAPLEARKRLRVKYRDGVDAGTLTRLIRCFKPDVVHFIGHGTEDGGPDAAEPALLLLKMPRSDAPDAPREAAPFVAARMSTALEDSSVRLLVLSACSTARAPTNRQTPQSGFAQNVVAVRNAPAVVAMQFPLEADVAATFSADFYENLLERGLEVDEALYEARRALAIDPGHRAWACPALFWRNERGNFLCVAEGRNLTDDEERRNKVLIAQLDTNDQNLEDMARGGDAYQKANRDLIQKYAKGGLEWRKELRALLPASLALGGAVAFNRTRDVRLPLILNTQTGGRVMAVRFSLSVPPGVLESVIFRTTDPAACFFQSKDTPGRYDVIWEPPGGSANLLAGETLLGNVILRPRPDGDAPVARVVLHSARLQRAQDNEVVLSALSGFIALFHPEVLESFGSIIA